MNTITVILEVDADGTLHLPLPADMRHGKISVTATLEPVGNGDGTEAVGLPAATSATLQRRKAALQGLRDLGGLTAVVPDPAEWQRQSRTDRSLPGRD